MRKTMNLHIEDSSNDLISAIIQFGYESVIRYVFSKFILTGLCRNPDLYSKCIHVLWTLYFYIFNRICVR